MATKFITIRIPIPSLSWFKRQEEDYIAEAEHRSHRISEIQARIAALRSSIERSEKSDKITQTQPEQLVVPPATVQQQSLVRDQKERELNDIKAKLLGKKK